MATVTMLSSQRTKMYWESSREERQFVGKLLLHVDGNHGNVTSARRVIEHGGCKPRSIIIHLRFRLTCGGVGNNQMIGQFACHLVIFLAMTGIAVGMDVAQFLREMDDSSEDDEEGNGVIYVCKCLIVNEISSRTSVKKLPLGVAFAFLALPMDVCWLPAEPGWNSTRPVINTK